MNRFRPLWLLLPLLVFSCGLNNTMYNARKYFKAAQARPLNANGRPSPQAVEEYTKTIKKCGIILSDSTRTSKTDDALYLMARALYYKGNSAFQAKDQFESLIKGFPDSKDYGEAHIYLARVYREVNRKEDASDLLENFILDETQKKLHPRALFTLAEFATADEDYIGAQIWLGRIIAQFPKSKEYREAFFLYGKNYFIQNNFRASLTEFQKISSDRRIPQPLKLEARYYIGLNQFLLGDHDASWKTVQKLLKDEDRPDKLAQVRVLKTRLLFARGEYEEGVAEAEAITQSSPRTQSAAEAQYRLGEHYFHQARDLEKAGTAFNRVRTEFANSELAEPGQQKSQAINQLRQNSNLTPEANLQGFVDYHISAAEIYLSQFALPDSALMLHQRVIDSRDTLRALRDSLSLDLAATRALIDSLAQEISLLPEPVEPDSLSAPAPEPESVRAPADSIAADSLQVETDLTLVEQSLPNSLNAADVGEAGRLLEELPAFQAGETAVDLPALPDSLMATPAEADSSQTALADSLAPPVEETAPTPAELRQTLQTRLAEEENNLSALEDRLANLEESLLHYERDIIPLALFSQASIHNKTGADSTTVLALQERMNREYPGHKYANALDAMVSGAPVRLIDPAEEAQELRYDQALELAADQPDSMLVILNELALSDYTAVKLRSNFRLGWHYTFEQPDTTAAKPYLVKVLELEKSGDYASLTSRFFDGSKFRLDRFDALVDSLDAKARADSLKAWEDMLAKAKADSLALADSLAAADSLAVPEAEAVEGGEARPLLGPEGEPEAPLETPERKEENPAETDPGLTPPGETVPELPAPGEPLPELPPPGEPVPPPEGESG